MRSLDAVIFDMDGVLIDSEPIWQEAERLRFGEVGLDLDVAEMVTTMGLRVDEVVSHWYARRPWPDAGIDHAALAGRIVDTVVDLVSTGGEPLPGVADAVAASAKWGLGLAVASSSPSRVIDAALQRLGLADRFPVVCSAQHEPYGKPHPAVFLSAAAQLGVAPTRCLVVEDSVHGMVAALAARMHCVVVPDPERSNPRFAAADHVLDSLEGFPALLEEHYLT